MSRLIRFNFDNLTVEDLCRVCGKVAMPCGQCEFTVKAGTVHQPLSGHDPVCRECAYIARRDKLIAGMRMHAQTMAGR